MSEITLCSYTHALHSTHSTNAIHFYMFYLFAEMEGTFKSKSNYANAHARAYTDSSDFRKMYNDDDDVGALQPAIIKKKPKFRCLLLLMLKLRWWRCRRWRGSNSEMYIFWLDATMRHVTTTITTTFERKISSGPCVATSAARASACEYHFVFCTAARRTFIF